MVYYINIFNSIRMVLLILNICMAMYIIFLYGQLLRSNDSSEVSTHNTSKVLHNKKLAG